MQQTDTETPKDRYLRLVRSLRSAGASPSSEEQAALVELVRSRPHVHAEAKPDLLHLARSERAHPPDAPLSTQAWNDEDFVYNNVHMTEQPWGDVSPRNLDQLLAQVKRAVSGQRWRRRVEDVGLCQSVLGRLVAPPRTLKALGDGWGFSQTVHTLGTLVRASRLDRVLPIERELLREPHHSAEELGPGLKLSDKRSLFRFQAGITFEDLNRALARHGCTVLNQPGYERLTYGGVMSVGGHGSGLAFGNIASQVRALELVVVDAQREPRLVRLEPEGDQALSDPTRWRQRYRPPFELIQDTALFQAARVGVGAMGFLYAVVAEAQPAFRLEEHREVVQLPHDWDKVQSRVNDAHTHSVHLWTNPYSARGDGTFKAVVTWYTEASDKPVGGKRSFTMENGGEWWATSLLQIAVMALENCLPNMLDTSLDSVLASEPVVREAPEALLFASPNHIPVLASSCGFPAADAPRVVANLQQAFARWRQEQQLLVSSPIGVRWVSASQDLLAPQRDRDTIMIEVPVVKGTRNAEQTLERYVAWSVENEGRPHWGQRIQGMSREDFQRLYGTQAIEAFVRARRRLDPTDAFAGPFLDEYGLR